VLPRSLIGQMILLMGIALLIAQLVNFTILINREQRLSLAQSEGPAVARFVQAAALVTARGPDALPGPPWRDEGSRRPRFRSFTVGSARIAGVGLRDAALEARLSQALRDGGIAVRQVHARRGDDRGKNRGSADRYRQRGPGRRALLLISAQLGDGQWLNARMFVPRPDPFLIYRLLIATAFVYLLVLGAVVWIAVRITRPLGDLTRAAQSFAGRQEAPNVEPRGPEDLRKAIHAFNAMNRRVVGLLDEKDRMLGAIGHDLRTPLASMRIRLESMNPEEDREALVATIQEMSDTLEDILVLARTGRSREPERMTDVSALADSVVEDFIALGVGVEFEESLRLAQAVQPNLLRRALRNLIDNAVKYGGGARVRVFAEGASAAIEVDDDGPGIAENRIAHVLQPFERLESSRSRETGGTGLGLAIARAIAEAHGGSLTLSNRAEGGLRARLVVG
jgi:signal transduction histidine kinase